MQWNKKDALIIVRDLFVAGFILFFVLSVMELIKPRIVMNYLNLDLYLLLLIFVGAITIMFEPESNYVKVSLSFYDHLTIFIFAILIGVGAIFFLKNLGFISILIGLLSVVISYFTIILVYKGR
jgi:hypothetical protein